MAGSSIAGSVQIVNIDLGVERQRIIREKLREFFKALNSRGKTKKELVYTLNQSNSPLEQVVRANPEADVLFTGFGYDIDISEEYKEGLLVDSAADAAAFDPGERYPVIGIHHSLIKRGYFRPRKLVLVGDIQEKITQALKSSLPVELCYYIDSERKNVSQLLPINSARGIIPHDEEAQSTPERVVASQISTLTIAGIPFAGVVNMPEIENRFVLEDQTLLDTTKKLYTMEAVKEVILRESLLEEKMTFVRGKKVFIVLEEDLEHVISDRLVFDKMQRIFRHHTLEEALKVLEDGRGHGISEYFESEGYDVIFDTFDQEERDGLMLYLLGDKLGGVLQQEIKTQRGELEELADEEIQLIFRTLPEPLVDKLMGGLQQLSYEKFLALVPLKIRESVIHAFFSDAGQVRSAWQGMKGGEQKEILNGQAPYLLAHLYAVNTPLFKNKFANIKFEFDSSIHSSSLAKMGSDEKQAAYNLVVKSLEKAKLPPGVIPSKMNAGELTQLVSSYIPRNPGDFFNRLNPLMRKQMWHRVGNEFRERITENLHYLDKIEILKGNSDAAMNLLFSGEEYVKAMTAKENTAKSGPIFLVLKKHNKIVSKTALLRKILSDKEWRAVREKKMRAYFADPKHQETAAKLAEQVEDAFNFAFDSLICTKDVFEELKEQEPLKEAEVTLIDDLVDSSLFNLFQNDGISKEDYDSFRNSVEDEIKALRDKMSAKEMDDPVGVYLLESMQILNEMTNEAIQGKFNQETIDSLDERRRVRERMVATMKEHLEKVRDFLAKAGGQESRLEEKVEKARNMEAGQTGAFTKSYDIAKKLQGEGQQISRQLAKVEAEKKNVAMTQKELSLQFFHIIQPLILSKVRGSGGILKTLLRPFGFYKKETEALAQRIIFKFSDEEINNILENNIVFCSRDEILMQFILTCLRIDDLQDSLFTLTTPQALPRENIDILFYGPGYEAEDFKGQVKKRRIVSFADQEFIERLTANEKRKSNTKTNLIRLGKKAADQKEHYSRAARRTKGQQVKLAQISRALQKLLDEKVGLEQKVIQQKERELHYNGELELLESRLTEVDGQFDNIKESLGELAAEGEEGAISLISSGREELSEKLQTDLMGLNKELARMMFIKGVKDAGDQISKKTQAGIIHRMDRHEIAPPSLWPVKKMLVADDGTNLGQNLKRVFINVAAAFFKLKEGSVEEITLSRWATRAEAASGNDFPFVVLFADEQEGHYGELRKIVKMARTQLPQSYQLVLAPFGKVWDQDHNSKIFKNIRSIKENCCLVNATIADYTQPPNLLRLLNEKTPRRSPRPAAKPAQPPAG